MNYYYNITYAAIGPTGEVGQVNKLQVWAPNTTLSGLANGVQYKFSVKASRARAARRKQARLRAWRRSQLSQSLHFTKGATEAPVAGSRSGRTKQPQQT